MTTMTTMTNMTKENNFKQLEMLNKEVAYISINGIKPLEEWYDDRFGYIIKYSNLNWDDLSERFYQKDQYIYETALEIKKLINKLIEERAIRRNFYIPTYHTMIYNVYTIWNYYNSTYVCGENDMDVIDLVEGMTFL